MNPMNNDELLNKPSDAGRHVEPGGDAYPVYPVYNDEISLQPLVRTLWSYRQVMSLAVAGVMGIFVVAMLAAYVSQAVERLGTLEFRLLFEGASQGQYPNGTLFSSAEITSTPVLTEVFEANDLERYSPYEDFNNSIFVLQSNPSSSCSPMSTRPSWPLRDCRRRIGAALKRTFERGDKV